MQYPVPQFIDIEPKIIGSITVRQFFMLAIALGVIFLFFKYADTGLFIFSSVVIVLFTIVVGFVRINGRPFHFFLINLLDSIFRAKHIMVWRKEIPQRAQEKVVDKKGKEPVHINYIALAREKVKTRSRLSDLSLLVDTGGYYQVQN